MPWKQKEDQKLKEVKAALRALQRIDLNSSAAMEALQPEPNASKSPVQAKRLGALALALIAAGTVTVLIADLFFKYWPASPPGRQTAETGSNASPQASGNGAAGLSTASLPLKAIQQPKPQTAGETGAVQPASAAPDPQIAPVLSSARQLMDAGQIVAARKMLLQPALAASQDAAWLIARSFDPNYLATIQSADATADKAQAEEWYRRWRDIGARNGAGMDDARLKRLIDAMQ